MPSLLNLGRYLSKLLTSCSTVDLPTDYVEYRIPNPALYMSTYPIPFNFISYSLERSPANNACVCASTYPGITQ